MFKLESKTRYSETGQDGIIHHSSYVVYLEEARIGFFRHLGCDIIALEKQGIFSPVVDISIRYLKPLYAGQNIMVEVILKEFSKVVFELEYKIFREELLVATALSTHCFTNASFKPIGILPEIIEKLKQL